MEITPEEHLAMMQNILGWGRKYILRGGERGGNFLSKAVTQR